jgi:hypothetical protein
MEISVTLVINCPVVRLTDLSSILGRVGGGGAPSWAWALDADNIPNAASIAIQ